MKTCSNCGRQNNDEDMFCEQCGAALSMNPDNQQSAQTAGYAQNTDVYQTQEAAQQMPPQTPYPMLQILKRRGGSVLFLVAIICMTVKLVAQIITSFSGSAALADLDNLMYQLDIPMDYSQLNSVMTGFSVGSLIGMIPSILILIGLWLIYANCKKQDNSPLSTTGFSLVRGVVIFEFVCYILVMVVCLLLMLVGTVAAGAYMSQASDGFVNASINWGSYSSGGVNDAMAAGIAGILVFVVIGLIIALVLGIVYYVKVIGSLKRAQEIVRTGSAMKNISAYVGVLTIILAVFGMISGLLSLNIVSIIGGVEALLFGILIMGVRKEFSAVLYMQNQANYMR